MVEERTPLDAAYDAARALGGVCDLLEIAWRPEPHQRGMHVVDSERLWYLLAYIQQDLEAVCKASINKGIQEAEALRATACQ